jgi:hypothetical protein
MEQINALIVDAEVSIERCRELLGDEAIGLSDEQVGQIRHYAETMARVVIDAFLEDRSSPRARQARTAVAMASPTKDLCELDERSLPRRDSSRVHCARWRGDVPGIVASLSGPDKAT